MRTEVKKCSKRVKNVKEVALEYGLGNPVLSSQGDKNKTYKTKNK